MMLHGSWMVQVGFILYPGAVAWLGLTTWDEEAHTNMMILPMMFAWHLLAVLAWQVVLLYLAFRRARATFGLGGLGSEYQYCRCSDISVSDLLTVKCLSCRASKSIQEYEGWNCQYYEWCHHCILQGGGPARGPALSSFTT